MAEQIRLKFNKRRIVGLTGNQLKLIAFIFMLCDHIGFMLIQNGMLYAQNPLYWNLALETEEGRRLYFISNILRTIGRLAFPVFAFLVSEGAIHTKNIRKYILRLLVFAFLSEIPFDLATREVIFYPQYQNVLFTFALSAMAIAVLKRVHKLHPAVKFLIISVFCFAGFLIKSDYGAMGVLMVLVLYITREDLKIKLIAGVLLAAAESISYACASALSFVLIYFYNGRRGNFPMKYFFYIAYPAHLLLFWAMVYFANN